MSQQSPPTPSSPAPSSKTAAPKMTPAKPKNENELHDGHEASIDTATLRVARAEAPPEPPFVPPPAPSAADEPEPESAREAVPPVQLAPAADAAPGKVLEMLAGTAVELQGVLVNRVAGVGDPERWLWSEEELDVLRPVIAKYVRRAFPVTAAIDGDDEMAAAAAVTLGYIARNTILYRPPATPTGEEEQPHAETSPDATREPPPPDGAGLSSAPFSTPIGPGGDL